MYLYIDFSQKICDMNNTTWHSHILSSCLCQVHEAWSIRCHLRCDLPSARWANTEFCRVVGVFIVFKFSVWTYLEYLYTLTFVYTCIHMYHIISSHLITLFPRFFCCLIIIHRWCARLPHLADLPGMAPKALGELGWDRLGLVRCLRAWQCSKGWPFRRRIVLSLRQAQYAKICQNANWEPMALWLWLT